MWCDICCLCESADIDKAGVVKLTGIFDRWGFVSFPVDLSRWIFFARLFIEKKDRDMSAGAIFVNNGKGAEKFTDFLVSRAESDRPRVVTSNVVLALPITVNGPVDLSFRLAVEGEDLAQTRVSILQARSDESEG